MLPRKAQGRAEAHVGASTMPLTSSAVRGLRIYHCNTMAIPSCCNGVLEDAGKKSRALRHALELCVLANDALAARACHPDAIGSCSAALHRAFLGLPLYLWVRQKLSWRIVVRRLLPAAQLEQLFPQTDFRNELRERASNRNTAMVACDKVDAIFRPFGIRNVLGIPPNNVASNR